MKAVRIHSFGGLDELRIEDTPSPVIRDTEVLVQIHDAGINPVDWKIREGLMQEQYLLSFPITMGQDCAGLVFQVGAKVSQFKKGDKVFGFAPGSYAEYAAIQEDHIAHIPKSMDFITAASLPTAGLTAWQLVMEAAALEHGQSVLIHGAAGGVGSLAVQLARWKGARVTAVASHADFSYLKSFGVEHLINYKTELFEEHVRNQDVVLDLVGGQTGLRSLPVIKKNGLIVSTAGAPPEAEVRHFQVRSIAFVMQPDVYGLDQIGRLVEERILQPRVNKIVPFFEARRAQEINERGLSRGKTILEIMR